MLPSALSGVEIFPQNQTPRISKVSQPLQARATSIFLNGCFGERSNGHAVGRLALQCSARRPLQERYCCTAGQRASLSQEQISTESTQAKSSGHRLMLASSLSQLRLLAVLTNVVTMPVSRRTRIPQCLAIETVDWWRMSRPTPGGGILRAKRFASGVPGLNMTVPGCAS